MRIMYKQGKITWNMKRYNLKGRVNKTQTGSWSENSINQNRYDYLLNVLAFLHIKNGAQYYEMN